MCGMKDCEVPGMFAPKFVFVVKDGTKKREIPSVLGLTVCDACRKSVTDNNVLKAPGDKIVESLLKEHPTLKHVETRLEWLPLSHPEYLRLKGLGPS
jgi:hypothetical protein